MENPQQAYVRKVDLGGDQVLEEGSVRFVSEVTLRRMGIPELNSGYYKFGYNDKGFVIRLQKVTLSLDEQRKVEIRD